LSHCLDMIAARVMFSTRAKIYLYAVGVTL
jgi:hypothetical protein